MLWPLFSLTIVFVAAGFVVASLASDRDHSSRVLLRWQSIVLVPLPSRRAARGRRTHWGETTGLTSGVIAISGGIVALRHWQRTTVTLSH
jgi:hypothetical protein